MVPFKIGDRARYQPYGSDRPYLHVTVFDIRRKQDVPGVYGPFRLRVRIGRGRGCWVDAARIFPEEES